MTVDFDGDDADFMGPDAGDDGGAEMARARSELARSLAALRAASEQLRQRHGSAEPVSRRSVTILFKLAVIGEELAVAAATEVLDDAGKMEEIAETVATIARLLEQGLEMVAPTGELDAVLSRRSHRPDRHGRPAQAEVLLRAAYVSRTPRTLHPVLGGPTRRVAGGHPPTARAQDPAPRLWAVLPARRGNAYARRWRVRRVGDGPGVG